MIVDNLSNSNAEVADAIAAITGVKPEFEIFDLADREKTADFFSRHTNLQGVIHFAAFKAVGESVAKPLMYYRNNLVSLMNILEGMMAQQIPNLVFSSSCTVYGQPDELPVSEKSAHQKKQNLPMVIPSKFQRRSFRIPFVHLMCKPLHCVISIR